MNYPKKVNRKRRKKQSAATEEHGLVKIEGVVTLDGKATTYYPKQVLKFKRGTAAVIGVHEVERLTKLEDLPPLAPKCEARA